MNRNQLVVSLAKLLAEGERAKAVDRLAVCRRLSARAYKSPEGALGKVLQRSPDSTR
jgi:hypothetical protein